MGGVGWVGRPWRALYTALQVTAHVGQGYTCHVHVGQTWGRLLTSVTLTPHSNPSPPAGRDVAASSPPNASEQDRLLWAVNAFGQVNWGRQDTLRTNCGHAAD